MHERARARGPQEAAAEPAAPEAAPMTASPARLLGPDAGLRAGAAVALQRSAGNASVARWVTAAANTLARDEPPVAAPAAGASPPVGPAPPTPISDRKGLMTRMAAAAPSADDCQQALLFLNGQSLTEMVSVVAELHQKHPVAAGRLRALVPTAPGIANGRTQLVLDAVLLKGQIARLDFEALYTREIVPLTTADPTGLEDVLKHVGPGSKELEDMKATAGYQALSGDERAQLAHLVAGSTSLSKKAPAAMRKMLDDATVDKKDPESFRKFIKDENYLNFDVRLPNEARLPRDKYTVGSASAVKDHDFKSGVADASKSMVEVEGKDKSGATVKVSVEVFEPTSFTAPKPGRVLPTVDQVAQVLAELPMISRQQVKRVNLNPKANPADAQWAADPNYNPGGGEFVSHMTASTTGTVNIYPSTANADVKEIETTMLHESGHTISGRHWGHDNKDAKWTPWKEAMRKDGMQLSTYGKSSPNEDFAEAWALFAPAYGKPREMEVRALIPNRFKLIEELVKKP